ncbi:SGNH/GDSL hydrolase family protein [Streptomyces spinosisporus]|uniref:SGNH/GDSL hydrolase family protein n=1 Tax=Streptomyces spinosisporus TaxID=2927582 RepID=A0ABS9XHD3_9ACTN|nr:SGNH/GDSL hydrolase family protein [Streptomyces spinosisporus]MCI3241012.1 SGNH/GDSL hydrolase family protein [Streptomyces spinosisporus]
MTSMSRARVARRIAAGAAYGGGGIGLAGAAAVGLVLAEVHMARRHVGNGTSGRVPVADGLYGTTYTVPDEPPLRLTMLGDSTAAGQGVHRAGQTPGALLASGLSAVAERPVVLHNVALPGATSDDLDRQVALVLANPTLVPDICVIMIGANDVTHRMPPTRSVRHLSAAVRRLRTAGAEVVVGTCPDLGTVERVQQPLRWLARRSSRQLAAAQTIGTVAQGGRTVSLGDLLGPEFEANPRELFGPDNYHPSAEGYATAAMAVLPTVCAALGVWPEEERPDVSRREGFLPVARAAAEAASEAGTEVTAAMPTGPRGPWALLKRRRRRRVQEPETETETETEATQAAPGSRKASA